MSTVLVTGSEGSLMQSVIPLLIAKGHTVYGVDNLSRYGRRRNPDDTSYRFIQEDLTDDDEVRGLVWSTKPDYVIQAAATIYGVGGFTAHAADILGNDVALHRNVMRAARDYNVKRVIYISSSMVYETCHDSLEDSPERNQVPKTDYGLSKLVGERLTKAYWEQYRVPYTIWRPFNIMTPFEKSEGEQGTSHVFADFFHQIVDLKNRNIPLIGDGFQTRCFTDIRDTSQAIADLSFIEETVNQVFNLGSVEEVTMRELARRIADAAHVKGKIDFTGADVTFHTVKEYPNDVRRRVPSMVKMERLLLWRPKYNLDDTINHCLENT